MGTCERAENATRRPGDTLIAMRAVSRRIFLGVAGSATLLAAGGCSSDRNDGGAVTIKHRFGETTVPAPPTRVVSAGFTEQDSLLAVGVVPIAVTNWWGDQPFAVWPWAQPKLGSAQPVVLQLDNGLQINQIGSLRPDLIVATNAGVDQDSYNQLSAIAPTIPQSGNEPFFEPWKVQATAIGQAVFQAGQMESLINAVNDKFTAAAQSHPGLKDKKVLLLQGTFYQDKLVATLPGWRTEFLTQLGMQVPEEIREFEIVDDRVFIPRDKARGALDDADALIWTTEADAEQAALLADPTVKELDATKQNRNVFTGKDLAGAIAFSSPLSLPVVADQLPPLLSQVLS